MDVPFCDAVINFDKAMGSRQLMQRGGRARTEERVYASLVANDDEKASDELRRMLVWNALVGDELRHVDSHSVVLLPLHRGSRATVRKHSQHGLS